jgi:S-(hydroxymethyl)glutathione dehydrogenase/alcohol dehydrogenase
MCLRGRSHLCTDREATRRSADDPRLSQNGSTIHQAFDLSSFAQHMVVHESAVVAIDPAISLEHAAMVGCGVATGLGAVFNTAGVQPGETVVVIGCGGVGLSAVQAARIAEAEAIIAIDAVADKLQLARTLGATHVVDSSHQSPIDAVLAISVQGVDHVIEAVGRTETIESGFAMLGRGGSVTVVGLVPEGASITLSTDALFYERSVKGSVMGSNQFKTDVPRYLDMYRDGLLNLDDLVTRNLTIDGINEGFDLMRARQSVRSLVVFD